MQGSEFLSGWVSEFLLTTRKIKKLFFRENVATGFKLKASQQEAKTQWGLCLVS